MTSKVFEEWVHCQSNQSEGSKKKKKLTNGLEYSLSLEWTQLEAYIVKSSHSLWVWEQTILLKAATNDIAFDQYVREL